MKYFLIAVLSVFFVSAIGQNKENEKSVIRLQGGYTIGSNKKDAALNDGAAFKLTWDEYWGKSCPWFFGLGTQYQRTSFNGLSTTGDISADVYAFTFRSGYEFLTIGDNLSMWGALEAGAGLMQSRHAYEGARYRLKNATAVVGLEFGVNYRLTDRLGLSATWNGMRYGNDNLQHGFKPAVLPKASIFSTSTFGIGVSITF